MPPRQTCKPSAFDGGGVDLLRVRLEQELPLPAVIAITSATGEDGKELVAQALALSYALTGYSTLFIDTSLTFGASAEPPRGLAQRDIVRRRSSSNSKSGNSTSGKLTVLTYNNLTLLRTTSFRTMKAMLEILRGKFDCVVISTGSGATDAFAAAIVAAADALLVTVKQGRRKTPDDRRLASELDRQGRRFLGIITVESAVTATLPARFPVPETPALDRPSRKNTGLIGRFVGVVVKGLRVAQAECAAEARALAAPEVPDSPTNVVGQASRVYRAPATSWIRLKR